MKLQLHRKGVALGLVVGLLGGAAGGALATNGRTRASTTTTTTTPPRQALADAFLSDVAGKLGIDVAKLRAALQAAAIDRVNQAVKDGKLTQAQADPIIQRIQSGALGAGPGLLPGFRFGGHRGGGVGRPDLLGAAGTYLGLTAAQLRADLQAGKSLADVATAHGKTVAGLEGALVAAAKQAIESNANLTAAQKTAIEQQLQARIDALVTRTRPDGGAMAKTASRWR
jgi:hypothetical protein